MRITSITIENFKGIRDRVTIDLKPITLLFGPNSAGKSTIIQALHYAWEVIGRHNLDPNFTEFGGPEMDLGGFENLVHGHDLSRSISIRLDMDLMGEPLPIYGDPEALMVATSEYTADDRMEQKDSYPEEIPLFRWNIGKNENLNAWIEFQVSYSESASKFQVSSYEVGFNNEMISKIKTAQDKGHANIAYINFFHPLLLIKKDEIVTNNPWLNNLIPTYANKPEIWLDEKSISSNQYNIITDSCNFFKEYPIWKMTKEELFRIAVSYGYSHRYLEDRNRYLENRDRIDLIMIIIAAQVNEKNKKKTNKSFKNMTIKELRQIAKSHDIKFNTALPHGYFRSDLLFNINATLYLERMKQKNEMLKKPEGLSQLISEKLKPFLPYEFLFVCIEAFGIHSIHEDLNIECGLIDALPKKEGTFKLDVELEVSDGWFENRYCANAIDSAIQQIILGPLDILRDELEKLHYLGPIRNRIPRNYIPNRYIENRNWPDGLAAWDVLHKEDEKIVRQTDHWMSDRLKSGYHIIRKSYKEIDVSKVTAKNKNITEQYSAAPIKTRLYLTDQKSGVEVQPPDVGVGISQVIPVIVSALYFKDGIVSIEQPELHIHPALQVTLGDMFISQIQGKGPCFILETHSEHMLLRLLRRIRETNENTLPEGINELFPDQLKIYYIESDQNGVKISDLEIDETGEFKDEWPNGFFEEREEELFY